MTTALKSEQVNAIATLTAAITRRICMPEKPRITIAGTTTLNLRDVDVPALMRAVGATGDTIWAGATLQADLTGADLSGLKLPSMDFTGSQADKANFSGAELGYAKLPWVSLVAANLSDANLTGADLQNANLLNANLTRTTMQGAQLEGAKFSWSEIPMRALEYSIRDDRPDERDRILRSVIVLDQNRARIAVNEVIETIEELYSESQRAFTQGADLNARGGPA